MQDWQQRVAEMKAATLKEFPYETFKAEGAKALDAWARLKREGKGYPVVLGAQEDFERVAEQFQILGQSGRTPADVLAAAARYRYPDDYRASQRDLERKIAQMLKEDPKFKEAHDELLRQLPPQTGERPRRGPWPDEVGECVGLTVAEGSTLQGDKIERYPHKEVTIALFPTKDWTEIFALSGFGGWNSCPPPETHVAAFRKWNKRYQLDLVGMSGDVLNLRAGVKPATREDALALAREHYEFCPDLVDQGVSLDVLAAELMSCGWWYFWWD